MVKLKKVTEFMSQNMCIGDHQFSKSLNGSTEGV